MSVEGEKEREGEEGEERGVSGGWGGVYNN